MTGHGQEARVKNGPALAGHGAEAVRDAIARTIITLPAELRRSLMWDQGAEMAQHADLKIDAGVQVYFCDPHSPWQRGSNEKTNGLLRQYFLKGTDLSTHSAEATAVAATLNAAPARRLPGKRPPRRMIGCFGPPTNRVLRPQLESAQYTGLAFGGRCREAGIRPSRGSIGDAYDNSMCESFFATLECELLARRRFTLQAEAKMAVFSYIEGWYNPARRHSAISYISPIVYETHMPQAPRNDLSDSPSTEPGQLQCDELRQLQIRAPDAKPPERPHDQQ